MTQETDKETDRNIKADLALFVSLWNQRQTLGTPDIHFRIAGWLEDCWKKGRTNLLLMAFRSSGKSTMVGLFAAWLLYRNPDLRILVLAADLALARRMVRNVKRILERHPLTPDMKPARAEQWASDRFTVNRNLELRDPSMLAKGITANVTGSRADIIICDDVEVPNTCDTLEKRRELRERLMEIPYVLVPGGTQLYVGTPHSYYTIYAENARKDTGEDRPFLDGFHRLMLPILDENGQSGWPERFPLADIDRIRLNTGPNKFRSQMMLQPVNIAEGRLDPDQMQLYSVELTYSERGRQSCLSLGERRLVSCSAWWDPAFGGGAEGRGDSSVLAVIYTDESGAYWLHHMAYLSARSGDPDDEATQQCKAVARLAERFYLPSIAIEINGIGRFLPNILRRELAALGLGTAVVEISNRRPKALRILEAFDVVLAARALHVHDGVYQTSFVTEMREWRPDRSGVKDDGLDAVAGALGLEPVRIRRSVMRGKATQNWRPGSASSQANTDFEV